MSPPGDKAAKVAELQRGGKKVAIVGDAVNDAPAQADLAIETDDLLLMRSDPLDVPTALRIGGGTLRKMRQILAAPSGCNVIALPIAAGVFEPAFGTAPEIVAAIHVRFQSDRCGQHADAQAPTPAHTFRAPAAHETATPALTPA